MVVTITRSGYIKRTHVEAYRSQRRGGKGVTAMETKEEDIIEDVFVASTHSYLLFFTNLGKVHWLKVHEIPEGGRQAKGKAMVNLLALGDNERVATCVPVRAFTTGGYILFASKQGRVKKTDLEAYSHPRAGGIQAIGLDEGDEVITVRRTDGQREVMIATKLGMSIRFTEDEVRPMGRTAGGVRGIRETPVVTIGLSGENRAGLIGITADGDNCRDVPVQELVHVGSSSGSMAAALSGRHVRRTRWPRRAAPSRSDVSRFWRTTVSAPPSRRSTMKRVTDPRYTTSRTDPGSSVQPAGTGSPSSRRRIFSGRTVIVAPSRWSRFDVPTKPATNAVAGRS